MDPDVTLMEVTAAAHTAAVTRDYYPADGTEPDIIRGPKATTVLWRDFLDRWIVCVNNHDDDKNTWYVIQATHEAKARELHFDYAFKGLR